MRPIRFCAGAGTITQASVALLVLGCGCDAGSNSPVATGPRGEVDSAAEAGPPVPSGGDAADAASSMAGDESRDGSPPTEEISQDAAGTLTEGARDAAPTEMSAPSSDASPLAPTLGSPPDAGPARLHDAAPLALDAAKDELFVDEEAAREQYRTTPIGVRGRVVTALGEPVPSASVTLGGQATQTDADGVYVFAALQRSNRALEVTATGFKSELAYVHLARGLAEQQVELDALVLVEDAADITRFLFGGDTAFGRRFIDPLEASGPLEIPPSNPDALIDTQDPEVGTRAALQYVAQLFQSSDFPVVNLETPVTTTPQAYHTNKDYIFFTLPESLAVFPWLGVRYVGLGNNHVFDYLDDGVADTLSHLADYGIASSGAGLTVEEAFAPYRENIKGSAYSFLGMTSVTGIENPPLYVATAGQDSGDKGGAADLTDTERVREAIENERLAGNYPIVQLHTGKEYTYFPSEYARERMSLAVESGASLVVAHHPHVAQGFSFEDGVLIVQSLGNLCFDQARQETMLGLLARVDLRGEQLVMARGIPIYLEDYRPRPITGELAALLLRRVAEVSEDASIPIENNSGRVLASSTEPIAVQRSQTLSVDVSEVGHAAVDLRGMLATGESVVSVQLVAGEGQLQAGEDLLLYGDFEDWDVDDEDFELARWDVRGESSYPCLHEPFRGAAALCSYRESSNVSDSVIAFRNRVRVLGEALEAPNKDLSFLGYARGQNAGALYIDMRFYASEGEAEFGQQVAWSHPGGDFDWQFFSQDLQLPADEPGADPLTESAHAVRFFIFQSPPAQGTSTARFDDLAIVSWRPRATELSLAVQNPVQFVKLTAPQGEYELLVNVASVSAGQ